MNITVRIQDSKTQEGWELRKRIFDLQHWKVRIGFFGGLDFIKLGGKNVDVVKVAARHEFGLDDSAAKFFMTDTAEYVSSNDNMIPLEDVAQHITEGKNIYRVLMQIGSSVKKRMQSIMRSYNVIPGRTFDKEYDPVTASEKNSAKYLASKVRYKIIGKGGSGDAT